MKTILAVAMLFASMPALAQSEICDALHGAAVVNEDGEYLGSIANQYNSDSIFNEYGTYGSKYRSDSIWNEYGKNGSEYRTNTAFNPYTSNPPKIIKNRKIIGYLTVNKNIQGGFNPRLIGIVCYDVKPPN